MTAILIGLGASPAGAVSGAAFTTFNAHVDGSSKDVCKQTAINCNHYGAKRYVWLNGGPEANGLRPPGDYFFAVLVPGGQPNPNDGGPKNLSDDYDCYQNRMFTVGADGEVSGHSSYDCGTGYPNQEDHWLDSGRNEPGPGDPKPNWLPPFLRLYPYADTTNPGGVYIMAICSLADGYPVDPRDCKYDAFKVREVPSTSFYLEGRKFLDHDCDGGCGEAGNEDRGLPGWKITIAGTGPDGLPINEVVTTDENGHWEFTSQEYFFGKRDNPQDVTITVCEEIPEGWGGEQSCPTPAGANAYACPNGTTGYIFTFTPPIPGLKAFLGVDFGNWEWITVEACKEKPSGAECSNCGDGSPVEGWEMELTRTYEAEDGTTWTETIGTMLTGSDGCARWTQLECSPDYQYDAHEEERTGWIPCGSTDVLFPSSYSGALFSHTFCNAPLQGCTPGFWQGGPDQKTDHAGGQWLWNEYDDPQWTASGGQGTNPFIHTTPFNSFFGPVPGPLDGYTMMDLVNTGGGSYDAQKAGRSLVAAYLNASWGMGFAYATGELEAMWADAVANGTYLELHIELDAANNAYYRDEAEGPRCPISASGY